MAASPVQAPHPSGDAPQEIPVGGKTFFGHPRGLATLFMTEMWERFSWYGMRGILVLYLTAAVADGGIGMSESTAVSLYGVYNALVYMLAMPGGWIADRLCGARKAVLVGGAVIASGHYVLAIPFEPTFYVGLLLIAIGTGMLKPNISAMVGGLYAGTAGARRDAGFTIFYMAINVGAFAAPLVVGTVGENVNWHLGFGLAGVGMTLALIQYVLGGRWLGEIGKVVPTPATAEQRRSVLSKAAFWLGVAVVALVVDLAAGTYDIDHVVNTMTVLGIVVPTVYFVTMFRSGGMSRSDYSKVRAFMFFFICAVLFWMIYDQSGSLLNLFADEKTNRHIGGWEFPTSWFQSVNPVYIVLLAPLFASLWQALARRNREPGTPVKFGYAMLLIGASFGVMGLAGAAAAASDSGKVNVSWLLGVYLVQTLGELCLSPVGLSLSTKLAPRQFVSQIMGLWFLAEACGNSLNAWVTKLQGVMGDTPYYTMEGATAALCGVVFLLSARKVHSLMGDVT